MGVPRSGQIVVVSWLFIWPVRWTMWIFKILQILWSAGHMSGCVHIHAYCSIWQEFKRPTLIMVWSADSEIRLDTQAWVRSFKTGVMVVLCDRVLIFNWFDIDPRPKRLDNPGLMQLKINNHTCLSCKIICGGCAANVCSKGAQWGAQGRVHKTRAP